MEQNTVKSMSRNSQFHPVIGIKKIYKAVSHRRLLQLYIPSSASGRNAVPPEQVDSLSLGDLKIVG